VFQIGPEMPFFRQAKGLAEMGNTLGRMTHSRVMQGTAQSSVWGHLSKEGSKKKEGWQLRLKR
jgi:hypothetical protein